MFKVKIEQIDNNLDEEIIIKCHEINDDVLALVNKLKSNEPKASTITGFIGDDIYSIKLKDVYYIVIIGKKLRNIFRQVIVQK